MDRWNLILYSAQFKFFVSFFYCYSLCVNDVLSSVDDLSGGKDIG